MQLKFVTGNTGKVRELRTILNTNATQLPLRLPEIQAIDVDDVIRSKAEQAYKEVGTPVLVEDTGLTFVAWNGLPGALVCGTLAYEPRGEGGFGWDDIFIPDGYNYTFAEMDKEEKDRISMRKLALDKLQKFVVDLAIT